MTGTAVDYLIQALDSLGVGTSIASTDRESDLVVQFGVGSHVTVEAKRMSSVTTESLQRLIGEGLDRPNEERLPLVVADSITRDAREQLRKLGWGWLDLRGHIYVEAPGILLNTEIDRMLERPSRSDPLAGKAGLEVACLLLSAPEERWSIRGIARELGRAPSTVSDIVSGLRDEGLVSDSIGMLAPELFWRVVDRWPDKRFRLAKAPERGSLSQGRGSLDDVLSLGMDDPEGTVGWALTDTLAAVAYGAPIAARADHPPDFFVPSESVLRRARTLLGVAASPNEAAATARVAPVPALCANRVDAAKWADEHRPLAAPLYVALDLAQDLGRGREVLASWDPQTAVENVWNSASRERSRRGWARVW